MVHRNHHNQRISCEVQSGEFTESSSTLVTVEYAPDFNRGTNNSVVKRKIKHGADFKLNCESHENPPATAEWFFGLESPRDLQPVANKLKSLSVQNMDSSKKGFYKCVITNTVGSSIKSFAVSHLPNRKYSEDFTRRFKTFLS